MDTNQVITTQLTSKRLKFNKAIAYFCISLGVIMVLANGGDPESTHALGWGSLITLYGFGHLTVTRVRIWWNHK